MSGRGNAKYSGSPPPPLHALCQSKAKEKSAEQKDNKNVQFGEEVHRRRCKVSNRKSADDSAPVSVEDIKAIKGKPMFLTG